MNLTLHKGLLDFDHDGHVSEEDIRFAVNKVVRYFLKLLNVLNEFEG